MKQKTVWLVFVLLCLNITMSRADEGKLEVWKAPEGVLLNDNFTVKVRR